MRRHERREVHGTLPVAERRPRRSRAGAHGPPSTHPAAVPAANELTRATLEPQADSLLSATNAFLQCRDLASLGDAITTAIHGLVDATKATIGLVDPDGTWRLIATLGFSDHDLARAAAAIRTPSPLAARALAGLETWTADDDDGAVLRERSAAYGARSAFVVPIVASGGPIGSISVFFATERTFPAEERELIRSLASQAALAWELIGAREEQQRAIDAAMRQTRIATALLAAASRLAGLATLDELLRSLSLAARAVTNAEYAGVARRTADGDGFELVFVDGLAPEMEAMLRSEPLRAPRYPFVADVLGRDADQSVRLPDRLWALGTSHLAVAPIRIDGRVWGIVGLGVAATDPQPTDDWQALAEGLASIGAAAIARAMATEELDTQRRRSDTLLALSSALGEVHDRDEIERMVCSFIRTASRAPFAMVGRRDPDSDRFVVAATAGLDADQVERIEAALRASERPSLRELLAGGVTARTGEANVGSGMGIAAAMGAPIVVGGRTDGFLAIGAPSGMLVRPSDWHELLIAFAALTASAITRTDAVGALARQRDVLASEVEERTRSLRTAIEELRLASDAKTDFLANVSHELRTPLTSILGFAEILSTGLDGPLNDDQARDVETVRSNSRHLLELIDDLIDIASIEAGRIQLLVGPVAADEAVRDAVEAIRPLAQAKGVHLAVLPSDARSGAVGGSLVVAADRGRLREIVLNLLSNAVKFTPAGGRVDVSIGVEGADAASGAAASGPGPMVTIAVRDTGTGVAPADQERIFEKFVRIAPSATPGTGLGLPISRELARLHGGDLIVESQPGRGSTFTVSIPQADGR